MYFVFPSLVPDPGTGLTPLVGRVLSSPADPSRIRAYPHRRLVRSPSFESNRTNDRCCPSQPSESSIVHCVRYFHRLTVAVKFKTAAFKPRRNNETERFDLAERRADSTKPDVADITRRIDVSTFDVAIPRRHKSIIKNESEYKTRVSVPVTTQPAASQFLGTQNPDASQYPSTRES